MSNQYPTTKRVPIKFGERCTETGCEGCGNHDEPTISPFDLTAFNSNNNNTPSSKNTNSNTTTTTSLTIE